ncbi:formylmethanofuran dehydrogenase subunit E [Oscillibacter sp. PC13]|uniref:FmdE family protein n=1 Tax=Oscillibacter sp. PC13 TaxID=1855299 RepID=UPI0008F188CA|nr:FmdE family protein [Oscillibacter sp. PC13]SFQ10655.1 formylmethanofuran dehydrogenase subunit E [Oscillibacter sp. PC13]
MNKELWEKAVAFHGHECPGLALGVRLCEYVQQKLGLGVSHDEELVCIAETDSCPVDAVQAILSCTVGKGNLLYRPTGKTAYNFYNRTTGTSVRVVVRRNSTELTREERMRQILEAPLEALFTTTEVKYPVPETARIFNTLTCALCGEGVAEHMARLQDGKVVCLHCFRAYDR